MAIDMDTAKATLCSILNCGYADLGMLEDLYSILANSSGVDPDEVLRESVKNEGGLNEVLYQLYSQVTSAVTDSLKELMEDYEKVENKEDSELAECLGENFKPLTEEQIQTIHENIEKMEESYPFTNYLDSHFQNDLDQTAYFHATTKDNALYLIEYWLK